MGGGIYILIDLLSNTGYIIVNKEIIKKIGLDGLFNFIINNKKEIPEEFKNIDYWRMIIFLQMQLIEIN